MGLLAWLCFAIALASRAVVRANQLRVVVSATGLSTVVCTALQCGKLWHHPNFCLCVITALHHCLRTIHSQDAIIISFGAGLPSK